MLENKTILLVLAHPDDEVLFGWPILQNPSVTKKVLICSNDISNKDRACGENRKIAFKKVCDTIGAQGISLDYNSDFYKTNHREGSLCKIYNDIRDNIEKTSCDLIYTHNIMGEYGHFDHKYVHDIVMSTSKRVIVSDMHIHLNFNNDRVIPEHYHRWYFTKPVCESVIDLNLFNNLKSIYVNHGVWTWDFNNINRCSLYEV